MCLLLWFTYKPVIFLVLPFIPFFCSSVQGLKQILIKKNLLKNLIAYIRSVSSPLKITFTLYDMFSQCCSFWQQLQWWARHFLLLSAIQNGFRLCAGTNHFLAFWQATRHTSLSLGYVLQRRLPWSKGISWQSSLPTVICGPLGLETAQTHSKMSWEFPCPMAIADNVLGDVLAELMRSELWDLS